MSTYKTILSATVLAGLLLALTSACGAGSPDEIIGVLTQAGAEGKMVPGQFAGHGTHVAAGYDLLLAKPGKGSGKLVGIAGADYGMNSERSPDLSSVNKTLVRHWKRGGLVALSCHSWNPAFDSPAATKNGKPNAGDLRLVDLSALLDKGNPSGKRWFEELDRITTGLQELDRAGVVVLWRPFHEMNGAGFWWGNVTSGAPRWTPGNPPGRREQFIALWRHMHDYFTRVKGLHNLVWVFSTEGSANWQHAKHVSGNEHKSPLYYYPGDDVVDVVGVDYYGEGDGVPGFDMLAALGKPFALTEFGQENPSVRYDELLKKLRKRNPGICYFLAWNQQWSLGSHPGSEDLLREPWIVPITDLH